MSRKGLTKETILKKAEELVKKNGYEQFSLRELATALGVKPASIYNHMTNVSEITEGVGRNVLHELIERIENETEKLQKKAKFKKIAEIYRQYAIINPELYKTIEVLPSLQDSELYDNGKQFLNVLYDKLFDFSMSHEEKVYFSRMFRSAIHGFIALERSGYFKSDVNVDDSFDYMIDCLLANLKEE